MLSLLRMHEFDRVFDGDDVLLEVLVDVINHRGQRCRFTAARGARDQDEAFFVGADVLEHRWEL